ncbi:MAG: hypothetical protein ACRCSN_01875 [Dermatophilaceae bacterium]
MKLFSRILTSTAALILALLTPGIASAEPAAGDQTLDPAIVQGIADRAAQGAVTAADRQLLEQSAPELLNQIIDASQTRTGEEAVSFEQFPSAIQQDLAQQVGSAALAASTCSGTNRYQVGSSILGSTLHRFHSYVAWCWTNASTTVQRSYPFFDSVESSTVEVVGTTNYGVKNVSATTKEVHHGGTAKNCVVKYGCWKTWILNNWVTVRQSTSSSFRSSN